MTKIALCVLGLAFGDEGKGATVDYLTWKYNAGLVVRYNGGSQCGHAVVQPDGREHIFQQFGAGMFHPGVRTHLSRFMLVNPMNMMREEEHLQEVGIKDAWERTSVDPRALIITPFHRELNRSKAKGTATSCGHGVGICREMSLAYGTTSPENVLYAGDLLDSRLARLKLRNIQLRCLEEFALRSTAWPIPEILNDENGVDICWDWYKDWRELVRITDGAPALRYHETIIFEGAQGVLLDETHGEEGFNTWTDTTFNNANTLLDEVGYDGERIKVGVIRTYYTRHGAGPFPTEDPTLTYPEPHNEDTGFQGKFRRGHFDANLFTKALDIVNGIDVLALNHMDQEWHHEPFLVNAWWVATGRPPKTIPSMITGFGPTYNDRKEI